MLPHYKVITKESLGAIQVKIPDNEPKTLEARLEELVEEQRNMISQLIPSQYYKCHYFDSDFTREHTCYVRNLDDEVQGLSIKDGYDLVQFEHTKHIIIK